MWPRIDLRRRGTTLSREVVAGATTFATMSYIVAVQPTVLSEAGMDFGAVLVATCVGSAIATLLMAVLANYPIALAPAMGHNFYFVFGLCAAGIPWAVALGANFLAGVLFLLLTLVGIRERIVDALPSSLQHAIGAGIGLLVAFVGLQWGGIVQPHPSTLVTLGPVREGPVLLALAGIAFLFGLQALRVRGAVLWTMATVASAGTLLGYFRFEGFLAPPPSLRPTFLALDVRGALDPRFLEPVFVFFLLALFDTVGTLVGVASRAGLLVDGRLPRARRALLADSLGIVQGTLLGTSTITCYVESAAGVAEGGRTGVANVVTALLFFSALFLYPVVQAVSRPVPVGGLSVYPVLAPPLVLVGAYMLASAARIDWNDAVEALPAFACVVTMPFTFSIADGIGAGILARVILSALTRRTRELHPFLLLAAALFLVRFLSG
ncbi:MAG: adenine permease [Candidatus Binatia bacterium]|nr:MAG: adenine permease [Candidatus Binatia bacterium]